MHLGAMTSICSKSNINHFHPVSFDLSKYALYFSACWKEIVYNHRPQKLLQPIPNAPGSTGTDNPTFYSQINSHWFRHKQFSVWPIRLVIQTLLLVCQAQMDFFLLQIHRTSYFIHKSTSIPKCHIIIDQDVIHPRPFWIFTNDIFSALKNDTQKQYSIAS